MAEKRYQKKREQIKNFSTAHDLEEDARQRSSVQEIDQTKIFVDEMFEGKNNEISDAEVVDMMNTYRSKVTTTSHGNFEAEPSPKHTSLPRELEKISDPVVKKERVRAAAQAAILMGEPPALVAKRYNLSPAQAASWEEVSLVAHSIDRRDRLSNMLLVYIEEELKSLVAMGIVTSSEEWIMAQNAGDLATFYAVKADRLLTVLGALGRTEEARDRYVRQLEVVEQDGA